MNEREAHPTAAPIANDRWSQNFVHRLVLMAATAIGIYLCYRLARPFLPALVWALALAVLFIPFHRWLESKLKYPNLAASISVLVIGLIVIVPAAFVGQRLVGLERSHLVMDVIDRVPKLGPSAAYAKQLLSEKLVEHQRYIAEHGEDMPEIRNWKWGAAK